MAKKKPTDQSLNKAMRQKPLSQKKPYPLAFSFQLGQLFNRFQWYFKWCVYTVNLAKGSIVWNCFDRLLSELVKVYPDDSQQSYVNEMKRFRESAISSYSFESHHDFLLEKLDQYRYGSNETDPFGELTTHFAGELTWINQLHRILRDRSDAGESDRLAFDLGAVLDQVVHPLLDVVTLRELVYRKYNPPQKMPADTWLSNPCAGASRSSFRRPQKSNRQNEDTFNLRLELGRITPPMHESARLQGLCSKLGVDVNLVDFPKKLKTISFTKRNDLVRQAAKKINRKLKVLKNNLPNPAVSLKTTLGQQMPKVESGLSFSPGESLSTENRKVSPKKKRKLELVRDPKDEARDKWIYEKVMESKVTTYGTILLQLKKPTEDNEWAEITTEQRIWQIAREYANRHKLPLPKRRRQD